MAIRPQVADSMNTSAGVLAEVRMLAGSIAGAASGLIALAPTTALRRWLGS